MSSRQVYDNRLQMFLLSVFVSLLLLFFLNVACSPPQVPAEPPPASSAPQLDRWSADGIISAGEYAKVNTYGDYEINWISDEEYICVGLKVKTSGWVALGIQPGSLMKNADMVLGTVSDDKAAVYDQFSTGDYGPHPPDTELGGTNDILEFNGKEVGGYTTIEFKRALNTGDKYDHTLLKGVNKIIWSYGSDDQLGVKHIARGYGELDL